MYRGSLVAMVLLAMAALLIFWLFTQKLRTVEVEFGGYGAQKTVVRAATESGREPRVGAGKLPIVFRIELYQTS
ncbi:hypothetical protein [Pseudorhodoplanes sp.]|jgi:hypothetical protein|uniref:hypothetical protein n=1 Tax=Pseudorhodoplanes sp. TaxID=1934341 RepID=UPI003D0DFCCB